MAECRQLHFTAHGLHVTYKRIWSTLYVQLYKYASIKLWCDTVKLSKARSYQCLLEDPQESLVALLGY